MYKPFQKSNTHQKEQVDDDEESFGADNSQPLAAPSAGADGPPRYQTGSRRGHQSTR